jgi:SAM-dependent methyltransferase
VVGRCDGADSDFYRALAAATGAQQVIDLGCGTGALTVSLTAPGRSVFGVDPSVTMLDHARNRPGAAGVTWILGDSRRLPDLGADHAVMTGDVAQHIPDGEWQRTLADLRRSGVRHHLGARRLAARAGDRLLRGPGPRGDRPVRPPSAALHHPAVPYRGHMGERIDWWRDPGDDEDLLPTSTRTRRPRPAKPPGALDLVVTLVSLAAAFLLAPGAWFAVVISQMAFTGCSTETTCVYAVGSVVAVAHPIVTAVVAVLGLCWATARRRRGRSSWTVGLGTLVAVLAVFAAAEIVTDIASGGHLF